jgi:hypothetical protein
MYTYRLAGVRANSLSQGHNPEAFGGFFVGSCVHCARTLFQADGTFDKGKEAFGNWDPGDEISSDNGQLQPFWGVDGGWAEPPSQNEEYILTFRIKNAFSW